MRLKKRENGVYYVHTFGRERFSLKTKDKTRAEALYQILYDDILLPKMYQDLLKRLNALSLKIYRRQQEIERLLNPKKDLIRETQIENFVIKNIGELGLEFVGRQRTIKNGRVDILARKDGNNVALEVKAGTLTEYHLGQCLRYLNDPDISEVCLIGEAFDKSIKVFRNFPIQIFTVNMHKKGEDKFKKI